MHRKFITLILCLAMAVAGLSAQQARADEDTGKIVAGLAALAALGFIIHKSRDRDEPVTRRPGGPTTVLPPVVQPRPLPPAVARRIVPRHCLRSFHTHEGERRLVSLRCIEQNYPELGDLPRQCAEPAQTARGLRWGLQPRCLRRHGYHLSRG